MISLTVNDTELKFEHSLVSLSEWEAKYETPFFAPNGEDKTIAEMYSYFEFMLVSPKKKAHLVQMLSDGQMFQLAEYIQRSRTATTVREIQDNRGPKENITSELVYYWLVAFKIPFHPTETWHLNRLLMLVKVCSFKNTPPKKQGKMSKAQQIQEMRKLNEQRRAEMGTKG